MSTLNHTIPEPIIRTRQYTCILIWNPYIHTRHHYTTTPPRLSSLIATTRQAARVLVYQCSSGIQLEHLALSINVVGNKNIHCPMVYLMLGSGHDTRCDSSHTLDHFPLTCLCEVPHTRFDFGRTPLEGSVKDVDVRHIFDIRYLSSICCSNEKEVRREGAWRWVG